MKKLVLALAAVAMIVTPALAEVTPYGSARVAVVYVGEDADLTGTTSTSAIQTVLQGNSRIGIKANTGDVTGRVEIGLRSNGGDTYTRLIYGTAKLGGGTMLVGQTYTPYTKFANQVLNNDLGFIGFGALYDGRQAQLKYTMDMGLYFAAIENTNLAADGDYIPKLVVGYAGKAGDFTYNAGIGFQKYETTVAAVDYDVSSYLVYLCGDAKFGEFKLGYGIHYGTNLGDYGISGRGGADGWSSVTDSDSTGYGLMLDAGIAGFGFGIGYTADDQSDLGPDADAQMAIYGNYTAQIAKGFKIVPEITYVDYMDDSNGLSDGTLLLVGAKFQMDF